MKETKNNGAQSAQVNNAKNAQVITNESSNAKPRALKNLANDESKLEMFSKPAALRAVKTAFDVAEGSTRKYVLSLGFTANSFKQLGADDLQVNSKSGTRFCTWEVLNALKRYAEAADLNGERAAKEQRKAERARLAEAKAKLKAEKAAEREKAARRLAKRNK